MTVNRLHGAEALEQALGERGIRADVTYLPSGKQCAPDRVTHPIAGLRIDVTADEFGLTIPAGAVDADETLVLTAATTTTNDQIAEVGVGVVEGLALPCRVIDKAG